MAIMNNFVLLVCFEVFCLFVCFIWLHLAACGILVSRPGIEPGPSAVKVQHPNHWTTRGFPLIMNNFGMTEIYKLTGLSGIDLSTHRFCG